MKKALAITLLLASCAWALIAPGPGPQNPGSMRYNYGPSVLWNVEAQKWQAWWCGPKLDSTGKVVGGDAIWYSDSLDSVVWSPSRVVFQAAASGWDSYHTCDPSVLRNVKLAGVTRPFVMYYTGADGKSGGDNDGRIGVAYSNDGLNWVRVQQLYLLCQTTTSLGCQHFNALKLRANDPDPAFGGRYIAVYSQSKTDGSTGTYAVESPDGLNWWGNAGAPASAPQRLLFPASMGSQYMSSGVDLMFEPRAGRFLLTLTAFDKEYLLSIPSRWYGGIEGGSPVTQLAVQTVGPEGSYVPGFFRAADGYRPWSPGADAWTLWTMTSNRNIRGADGLPRETQLTRLRWIE